MNFEQKLARCQRREVWSDLRFAAAFLLLGIGIGVILCGVLS